uniref:peptide-methionine (R)-S-oxide reductase n=1 Tax=Nothobranchius furzeri TaxID=105023 RepID=A0A8C6P2W4_NOTFU
MSVIRTLYHRANMITEERDCKQEDKHIQHALKTCGYPTWAINKRKTTNNNRKKRTTKTVHKDSVIKHPEAWGPLKVCCRKCGNELGHEFLGDGPRDGQSCF